MLLGSGGKSGFVGEVQKATHLLEMMARSGGGGVADGHLQESERGRRCTSGHSDTLFARELFYCNDTMPELHGNTPKIAQRACRA